MRKGATGGFEGFGDGQDEFIVVGPADELHAYGKSFRRKRNRD
jgi:hypothetical protein